ncbi:MAG: fused MFS/spermidine synthase, partial [bacterium]
MRKRHLIFLLIFLSGFAGLIYEIVWTRQLTILFGVSIYAVSAVIAVFLLGLAAGSYLFGRLADRTSNPLIIFGIIELAVAGYALIFPLIAKLIQYFYIALHDSDYSRPQVFFLRFMLTMVLLLPPTLLMGGTLPVAAKLCSERFNRFGNTLARLYGLNTLGAMFGAALAGFFLLRWLGASGSAYVAVVCNGVVGAAARWMSRHTTIKPRNTGAREYPAKKKKKSVPAEYNNPSLRRKVLGAIFISGFCALGYEVLWTKMLTLILGNSSWAFSTVLVAFLASIAAGSLLIAPLLDRKLNYIQLFSLLQVLIAITAFFSLLAFRWLAVAKIGSGSDELLQIVFGQILTACLIMAPPTLMSGAVLPLAARLGSGSQRTASTQFGLTLAFNTAGSVAGSLAAGYFFISKFGIQNSIILLAVFNAFLGVWLLLIETPPTHKTGIVKKGAAFLVANALIVSLFIYKPPLRLPPPGFGLRYYKEDAAGIFSIFQHKSEGAKVFAINSVTEVSTDYNSMTAFRLMAYLPYLLHEKPNDALVITFGAGIVAGSLAQLDLNSLECVEINPKAKDVGRFFADENHRATDNPKLRLFIEDGRNFLSTSSRKYDIITADATHPTGADSWVLFTKEYYELCRQHLDTGGLFMQWLPLHALSENHYLTILATAAEV